MPILELLKQKSFAGFFWTMFLGAFNDNFFKNALVILITFQAAEKLNIPVGILVTLSAGIFILPFFLFSATAGQISDVSEKSKLIRRIKIFEIAIMLLAIYGFVAANIYFLLFVLFLMGFQSAIFGPVKYSIIPQLVSAEQLMAANALVSTATFLAILLGTLLGGLSIIHPVYGVYITSFGVIFFAVLGWLASLLINKLPPLVDKFKINYNIFSETKKIIGYTAKKIKVMTAVIGIAWFWFLGASFLSLFPAYAKEYLVGDEYVVNLLLTTFSIGIGLGSIICERLAKGKVTFALVPYGVFGMTLASLYLGLFSPPKQFAIDLLSLSVFLQNPLNLSIVLALILFSLFGGIYIVSLYSLVQVWADRKLLSRVIAGNNILNSLFMVVSSILIIYLLKISFTIPQIFILLSIMNLIVGLYILLRVKKMAKQDAQQTSG